MLVASASGLETFSSLLVASRYPRAATSPLVPSPVATFLIVFGLGFDLSISCEEILPWNGGSVERSKNRPLPWI